MPEKIDASTPHMIVIVTGPAGAGRSTAIRSLEDFGFEAIDNLPLNLLERLLSGPPLSRPLAIGIDPRTRDFSPQAVLACIKNLNNSADHIARLLYVDCSAEVLLRRFSETRRRHPLAPAETPRIGIDRELELLAELRLEADILIDTTELSPHDLRRELDRNFVTSSSAQLAVSIHSFAYKRSAPRGLDMILDLRFLRNPHWEPALRAHTGQEPAVQAYVKEDPIFEPFFTQLENLVNLLLPAYKSEGKSYFSIGLGCTGGQHRSVFVAEALANALAQKGWSVSIRHREIERLGASGKLHLKVGDG